jgi:hypothetical protein
MTEETMAVILIFEAAFGAFFLCIGFFLGRRVQKAPRTAVPQRAGIQRAGRPLSSLFSKKERQEERRERLIYENIENYGTRRAQQEVS